MKSLFLFWLQLFIYKIMPLMPYTNRWRISVFKVTIYSKMFTTYTTIRGFICRVVGIQAMHTEQRTFHQYGPSVCQSTSCWLSLRSFEVSFNHNTDGRETFLSAPKCTSRMRIIPRPSCLRDTGVQFTYVYYIFKYI